MDNRRRNAYTREEWEAQRRRMERRRILREKQMRRRRRILFGVIGGVVLVIVIVLAFFLLNRSTTTVNSENDSSAAWNKEADRAEAAPVVQETEPAVREIVCEITEADQHTGDLILVNSSYRYQPEANAQLKLVDINAAKTRNYKVNYEGMQLLELVMGPLDQMIGACEQETGSHYTGITSAHRSIEKQQQIYDEYTASYGEDYAKAYVATPGYSEHHTGLSMDLGIYYDDGSDGYFSDSAEAQWYDQNAYRFGFIRRYQESKVGITGISNEEWHFRYVGIPHAYYMHQNNLCLEEYLDYLMKNTSQEKPLEVQCNGAVYKIFYTASPTVTFPEGTQFTMSGTNMTGVVFTLEASV